MALLQIVHQMCQYKNFENLSIFGWDMGSDNVGSFFETQCRCSFIMERNVSKTFFDSWR